MPLKGERLDRPTYTILHSLRGGHVGEVWLCDHTIFGHRVVQKTYSAFGREDSVSKREPQLLYQMRHDHILRILEAQPDPEHTTIDAISFVTPYCEGRSILDSLEADFRFSLERATTLAMQTLSALTYVHETFRVLHRDIKPANIYLNGSRRHSYLGDFGSAVEMDQDGKANAIEGTMLYTPSEGGPVGGRIGVTGDVYQMGLTLFEMLNGRFRYEDLESKFSQLERRLDRGLRALPDSYFVFAPHVPDALRRVVRRAIAKDPIARFESAAAFSRAIRRLRFIDWTHVEGQGLDGRWEGTWPAHLPVERQRTYAVTSRVLRGGHRRLVGLQQLPSATTASRFGVEDATVSPDDPAGISAFFEAVSTAAAQRLAAR